MQLTILLNWVYVTLLICSPIIHNIENIVITELRIRFLPPDLTPVQSEMVELGVLGYSRTQHAEWYDEGVLSVSGHCHLGQMISKTVFTSIVGHKEVIIPPTSPKYHKIIPFKDLTYNLTLLSVFH